LTALTKFEARVVAIDISQKAIDRALALKCDGEIELRIGSAYSLPLTAESCDIVLAADLMNHLGDPPQFCSEVSRVLKKGGRFVGNAMSTRDPSRGTAALKGKSISDGQFSIGWNSIHNEDPVWLTMRYYRKADLKRLFQDFNWIEPPTEYEREDSGHPPPFDSQPHRHVFWKILVQKP
jgi:ubiquinone/menaquinone biosynthesis C-methylase UbiE